MGIWAWFSAVSEERELIVAADAIGLAIVATVLQSKLHLDIELGVRARHATPELNAFRYLVTAKLGCGCLFFISLTWVLYPAVLGAPLFEFAEILERWGVYVNWPRVPRMATMSAVFMMAVFYNVYFIFIMLLAPLRRLRH